MEYPIGIDKVAFTRYNCKSMSRSFVNMCCTQEQFNKAMALTGSEFKAKVKYFNDVWIPAMALAEATTERQFEVITVVVITPTTYCYLGYMSSKY